MTDFDFVPEWTNLEDMFERGICGVLDIDVFTSLNKVDVDYQGNYLFFDSDSNCIYVGESKNIKKRVNQHLNAWDSNKKTINSLQGTSKETYEEEPQKFAIEGVGIDALLDRVEFVITIRNWHCEDFEKLLIQELNPEYNKNAYMSNPVEGENPSCPSCGSKLYWKPTERGFVCKNWRCDNYWKLENGPVFDKNGELNL